MATPPQPPRDASPGEWAELATLLKANAEAVGQLTEQVQQLTQALGEMRAEMRRDKEPAQEADSDTESELNEEVRDSWLMCQQDAAQRSKRGAGARWSARVGPWMRSRSGRR